MSLFPAHIDGTSIPGESGETLTDSRDDERSYKTTVGSGPGRIFRSDHACQGSFLTATVTDTLMNNSALSYPSRCSLLECRSKCRLCTLRRRCLFFDRASAIRSTHRSPCLTRDTIRYSAAPYGSNADAGTRCGIGKHGRGREMDTPGLFHGWEPPPACMKMFLREWSEADLGRRSHTGHLPDDHLSLAEDLYLFIWSVLPTAPHCHILRLPS